MVRRLRSQIAFAAILSFASSAWGSPTLEELLRGIEKAAAIAVPLRGDGTVEIDGVQGKKQDHVVILARGGPSPAAPAQVFVDFRDLKLRALALAPGELQIALDGKAKGAKPDTALTPTSLTAEDLLPFSPSRCAAVRVADVTNEQFTLVCEPNPAKSQYALGVYKFDRGTFLPLQALLYKQAMTNLVKMIRFEDFVRVGSSSAPTRVVIQDFKLRTQDVLTLGWAVAPSGGTEPFEPKSFAAAVLPAAAK
jgi:hypothetical protein